MTRYRVRLASSKDIPTLTKQRHGMFMDMRSPARRLMEKHDDAFPSWARREMRARRLFCFLVETREGEVVGGGSLWLREVQPHPGFAGGQVPYLMSMYTDPRHRRRGIAALVLKRAIAWSRARGCSSISLHASRFGRPLYEKYGWKPTSEMELELD